MEQPKYLGVDIGGTKIALVVGDAAAKVFSRVEFPTRVEIGPDKIIQRIVEEGHSLLQQHKVVAAGVSCGGPLDPETGVIYAPPNLPGWDQVPITKILAERWQLPVALQNDANAGALAEWQFGSGRGTRHFIFLTFGTGLGAGLILNGQLYEGANHLAGEVGHWRMAATGPYA
ncbi:MAG: ROK family protein, partial [Calditrichaeota bacterium]